VWIGFNLDLKVLSDSALRRPTLQNKGTKGLRQGLRQQKYVFLLDTWQGALVLQLFVMVCQAVMESHGHDLSILIQESLRVTVRLKTGAFGRELTRSAQK